MSSTSTNHVSKPFALVTGASQGLGEAIASGLAKRHINLLLTALPGEGLPALASHLALTGIAVHYFETDLSKKENVLRVADWANAFPLFILINNAGRGGTKLFLDADADYLDQIMQLNMVAPSLLTHQLLPNMLGRKKSYILNVSSMAAFCPIGCKTVYPASKKFIQHFSAGLREELKGTPVSVSVLLPGAMRTNADATQRIERQGFWGNLGVLPTERIAEIAIGGMLGGQSSIVPGRPNWWAAKLLSILPTAWSTARLTKAMRRELGLSEKA